MYKQKTHTHIHTICILKRWFVHIYTFIFIIFILYIFYLLERVNCNVLAAWLMIICFSLSIASLILIHFLTCLVFFLLRVAIFVVVVVVSFYIYFYRSLFRQNFGLLRILNVIQFNAIYSSHWFTRFTLYSVGAWRVVKMQQWNVYIRSTAAATTSKIKYK